MPWASSTSRRRASQVSSLRIIASLVARAPALGHRVRLMPPAYAKPYVKQQKNAGAEAICEAVTRANMRFVETKTPEQQNCLMLHCTCHLFIRQQTAVINAIRAHLPSSESSRELGATVSRSCSRSLPIQPIDNCPK
jgi:hypothetical protein